VSLFFRAPLQQCRYTQKSSEPMQVFCSFLFSRFSIKKRAHLKRRESAFLLNYLRKKQAFTESRKENPLSRVNLPLET
jgi:hypothetical protein